MARGPAVLDPIDQRLRMLDANPHREWLGLEANPGPQEQRVDIARRVAGGEDDGAAGNVTAVRQPAEPLFAGLDDDDLVRPLKPGLAAGLDGERHQGVRARGEAQGLIHIRELDAQGPARDRDDATMELLVAGRLKNAGAASHSVVPLLALLADNLTVLENVVLGSEPTRVGVLDRRRARRRIAEISDAYSLGVDPDELLENLGVGDRQRVEILKVLYRGARKLILDEPTAVLVPQEVDELFGNLRELKAEGLTVLFISHKLDEVLSVADRITVMRRGTTVRTVSPVTTLIPSAPWTSRRPRARRVRPVTTGPESAGTAR